METILVTGAASGIGHACAQMLVDRGEQVVGVDLQRPSIRSPAERFEPAIADVSSAADCAAAVQTAVRRFGKLDALVHCAATHSSKTWDQLDADDFNRVLAVNVTGSFLIAQAAARQMVGRNRGAIVLTASTAVIAAATGGESGRGGPAYIASKAAITGLVRTLARSLGPSGVRVNAIAPGVVDTPMIAGYSPENRAASAARTVLGRIGRPDDIAEVACFLVSDAARYMTGEVVIVNGGAQFG